MAGTSQSRITISPDQLEEIVTRAVTKAVTVAASRDHEQQIVLAENVRAISETVERLSHAVFGNGQDGLKTKVDRLETAHRQLSKSQEESPMRRIGLKIMEWLIMGVIFAVIALITMHGIPIK